MVKHRSKLKRGKTSKRSRGRKVKGISSKQNLDVIVKSSYLIITIKLQN